MNDKRDMKAIARAGFEPMVEAAGKDGRKLAALAGLASKIGLRGRVYPLATEARALAPDDVEVTARAQHLIGQSVPRWHFNMLRDEPRNAAFDAAIRRAVTPGTHVLDIGAGSGLLSMMAARAGAGRVVACEENPAIADAATRIVAANGYADRIRIVTGNSTELDLEADLEGPADVIVSEIVSNNLLAEGVLRTLADAASRLLAPGGQMIPMGGAVMVALANWGGAAQNHMGEVAGFDLDGFNALAQVPRNVAVNDATLTLHSAATALLAFDFTAKTTREQHRAETTLVSEGGSIGGIVQWIRLDLDAEGTYENRPGPDVASHWGAQFYPFEVPLDLPAGTPVRIAGVHDGHQLLVWREDSLPEV
ncbi:MAG: 50S ribosomal protein L11 methyltransferase [Sphingomonas sp.]|jgi:type II protein arginine methyltransferase|uniref:50S ribosomal protein L11 methyltransferase n=1 Tax=Sphingomonas sp. TaxID=28214 RepID=UPI003569F8BF